MDNYPISNWSDLVFLESGFHSNNVKISTDFGDLVVRQIFDDPLSINRMMYIYDYLSSNGFPTATPIKTSDGSYHVTFSNQHYVVQQFIPGTPPLTDSKEEALTVSKQVGIATGSFHKILQSIDMEEYKQYSPNYDTLDIISWLTSIDLKPEGIYFESVDEILDDEYVIEQYKLWLEKLSEIDLDSLQRGICHNDLKLADFRFDDGKIVGLLDFGSAEYSYHLYDIAGYMMYTNLYMKNIGKLFLKPFIDSYLEKAAMEREELIHLRFFIHARFLLQVFYFFTRIHSGNIQGVESDVDNYEGYQDGISFLKQLESIPKKFYTKILGL